MEKPPETPRFALVVWPDNGVGCIYLWDLERAKRDGAVVFATEFEPVPFNPPRISLAQGDGDPGGD